MKSGLPSFVFLLGDDIGWGDFSYNGGVALTPRIDAWAKRDGSITLQDMHSGGTVCSPTRATLLTGRNHFRDCVDYVYDCSDMTECEPDGTCDNGATCRFAPGETFTAADAVRQSVGSTYKSFFAGKWHLGSLYNDSSYPSSPVTHGFDYFNATVEVAPTADANCQCSAEWVGSCDFGHYGQSNHCAGTGNPCGSACGEGCCFNYWWNDASKHHAVQNLTWPSPNDDSTYIVDSLATFLSRLDDDDNFLAQLSFHNCHVPFIGTAQARASCASGESCRNPNGVNYTSQQLDYYACLTEFDAAVGAVLDLLATRGDGDNTLVWLATDNGPEVNNPGSAGVLRGRKRDVYEGGHRVPSIISWPSRYAGPAFESWQLTSTVDFLPTIMDVLNVNRPAVQAQWPLDGISIVPLFDGQPLPERGMGWWYFNAIPSIEHGFAFRYGYWKFVHGSQYCNQENCTRPQLFNLSADLGESHDLSDVYPDILQDMVTRFAAFNNSVQNSRTVESMCDFGAARQGPTQLQAL